MDKVELRLTEFIVSSFSGGQGMTSEISNSILPVAPRPISPVGIAAEHLEIAIALLAHTEVSDELTLHLQKALSLMAGLNGYLEQVTTPESPELTEIAQKTLHEHWQAKFDGGKTVRRLSREMLSGHVEGQTLKLFVRMTNARRVLEIGMFTGYSALAMAEALPEEGCLTACEVDPYAAQFAQSLFQKSPHGHKINVKLGTALDTLDQLAANHETFDFVFIDADKLEYIDYYQKLIGSHLLAPNGYICVDNTLYLGQVYFEVVWLFWTGPIVNL